MNTPELLMPAGNLEKLKYAFAYGADAVYAGLPHFSLRARENGFREEQLFEGAAYAHNLGKKFYLTANILGHNRKIHLFLNKIDEMMATKPDAIIMADPGLIDSVKEKHPHIPIHLSVQANVMNWACVKFWHKVGVSRIILSREVSIDEMKEIKDRVPEIEIECFVHGAICIAHSGRCLLSNYFQHRDANQGLCTNACRWPYRLYAKTEFQNDDLDNRFEIFGDFYLEEVDRPGDMLRIDEDEHGTYIMNARDLMAIEYLQKLWEAGVDSFKVEGRTKSIYYLALTTKSYRQAIDDMVAGRPFDPALVDNLNKLHNRGYTPGFLTNQRDDKLQRYEEGLSNLYTQEFGAVVKASEAGRLLITPRNKLMVGDAIEVISPESAFEQRIESFTNLAGEKIDALHGGTAIDAWIPSAQKIHSPFALVSKIIPKQ
jgi:putative protease